MTRLSVAQLFVLCCTAAILVAADPVCRDQHGTAVDWFLALKMPAGTNYQYTDSNSSGTFTYRGDLLLDNATTSPVMQTLAQVKTIASNDYGVALWNDEPPQGTVSSSFAHAKGIMAIGKQSGFLLIHSTPKFPNVINGVISFEIDSGQQIFGQHFFCISANAANLDSIARGYTVDWPDIYASNLPTGWESSLPNFNKMIQKKRDSNLQLIIPFKTLKGRSMVKFSSSPTNPVPLYDSIVGPYLGSDLIVESWGSPQEDANCKGQFSVKSNLQVTFSNIPLSYSFTKDHSKYAITTTSGKNFVCYGDINRQVSQWKRGGGTVCFDHQVLNGAMKQVMVQQQSC